MEETWMLITIIVSTVVATATVLGIYYSHKNKLQDRLKDLETKIKHHEKFINILESKALNHLEEVFKNKNNDNDKRKRK